MLKKYTDLDNFTPDDVIDLSGIQGAFKQFCLSHMVTYSHFTDQGLASDSDWLLALQQAQLKPSLTRQVLHLFEILKIPVFGNDGIIVTTTDKESGAVYEGKGVIHPCVVALGAEEWADRELEFFEYLLRTSNLPANQWVRFFGGFDNIDWCSLLEDEASKVSQSLKPTAQRILEGLVRHGEKAFPSTSPFSIEFWSNKAIWSNQENDEARREQQKKCGDIFGNLANAWYLHLDEQGCIDQAGQFFDWLEYTSNLEHLSADQKEEIFDLRWSMPVSAPYELESKPVEEALLIKCDALWHGVWLSSEGIRHNPSSEEKETIQRELKEAARECAENELKLPHNVIRELIYALDWSPIGHIRVGEKEPFEHKLSLKFLALMRSQIRFEPDEFDPYDYRVALRNVVFGAKDPESALKQLLMTLRQCPEPSCTDALDFKPVFSPMWSQGYQVEEPFFGFSPSQCASCFIHMIIDLNWHGKENRPIALAVADYCLSRITTKKGKPVEGNPVWRRAYVQALGELGYDLNKRVHRNLEYLKNNDPDDSVRTEAKHAAKLIKRGLTKKLDDRKGLMASFFWLRWAQREALGKEINEGMSMLTRRTELQPKWEHRVDMLYNHFLV